MKTNVTCESVEPLLTAYHLEELGGDELANVREHLAGCAVCEAASEEIAATLGLVCEALAEAPAVSHLDLNHRNRALAAQRTWAMKLRVLIDLPAVGPIPSNLWAGALAKAALIFLVPLSIALAVLVPVIRISQNQVAAQPAPVGVGDGDVDRLGAPSYEVGLVPPPEFPERDVLIVGDATGDSRVVATSAASLDHVADELHAPVLVHNEIPRTDKLGLSKPDARDAANLANATAPIAADIAKARALAQQRALAELAEQQRKMASHIKTDGRPRITSAMASPPPATNKTAITPVFAKPDSSGSK